MLTNDAANAITSAIDAARRDDSTRQTSRIESSRVASRREYMDENRG